MLWDNEEAQIRHELRLAGYSENGHVFGIAPESLDAWPVDLVRWGCGLYLLRPLHSWPKEVNTISRMRNQYDDALNTWTAVPKANPIPFVQGVIATCVRHGDFDCGTVCHPAPCADCPTM